ncbi:MULTISPECIES: DUF6309 family protein [Planktothrix]|jgi:hypothetical protein|uniref:Uncharacterized protein n=1 Tax=Planktothrix rubescens CCAP 1459/22 TaxID=329571 RepID=A0A6J7ZCL3_PLARU|nr:MULTISPECIES: DUF6309 family protein [Planktothrix]CAC5339788.1 conserved hypothetical protein [Planktothrix rubescens NIVA-CYA 18]CAD5986421.1 hypothetical protein PCC7821_05128 [Planktothrix rubescens NIVA-CYA 18]CAH2575649.1 hypothetical protein PRNO82_04897 [Planktothrix rubescens]
MKIVMKVEFDEVLAQFRSEHHADREHEANTNRQAEEILVCADVQLRQWSKVFLGRQDILRVTLPWHISEGGNIKLIPKSGLTVEQAVEKLSSMKDRYAKESPVCWNKIWRTDRTQFLPIFLSTKAITAPYYAGYTELDITEGLVHLDGLHRMIAWELNGLLTDNAQVEAYVAGNLSFYV